MRPAVCLAAGFLGFALALCAGCRSGAQSEAATDTPKAADATPVGETSAASSASSTYAARIAPIFSARCGACHGEKKPKGKLRLTTPAGIQAGSEDGAVLVARHPEKSEIVRRLRLPESDDDHMPPPEKPQPSAGEIQAIEDWIAAGAPFEGQVAGLVPAPARAEPAVTVPAADPAAIAELQSQLVHVERLARDSNLLWVDFTAVARETDDALVARLLGPVVEQVAELVLARSAITDATLAFAARMPNLRRLDLRRTKVTSAGIAALAQCPRLSELVLVGTPLSDAAVGPLCSLGALKRVYLWDAGLSAAGLTKLRSQRPSLSVDAGDAPAAASLEVEPAIELTSTAPVPGDPGPPVNQLCPVSGKPVDPKYKLVHDGRVIGFCCPNCPAEFSAHPEKYALKKP